MTPILRSDRTPTPGRLSKDIIMAENGKKTWKETLGGFLTKKGALIGAALVVVGGILEGTTSWVDGVVNILKTFFGG